MFDIFKRALNVAFGRARRPSRRNAPALLGLESRTLLSGQGAPKAVVAPAPLQAAAGAHAATPAVKPKKQVAFVVGLYHTYYHRAPNSAELEYALQQLATGVTARPSSDIFLMSLRRLARTSATKHL